MAFFGWTEEMWMARGEEALSRLSPNEYLPFVNWLAQDPQALRVYERSLNECLEQWNDLQTLRLPDGL